MLSRRFRRHKVPSRTETEIMWRSDRLCAICHLPGKAVQIHHINGDPNDNREENLCLLCLEHHNEASSASHIAKGLSPPLVRKYKEDWERSVRIRRLSAKGKKPRFTIKRELMLLEITRIISTIASLKANEQKEVSRLFRQLSYLNLLSGAKTPDLLDAFDDLVVDVAFEKEETGIKLSSAITDMFLHLAGPEFVEITPRNVKELKQAVDVLEYLGDMSTIEGRTRLFRSVCERLVSIAVIGHAYHQAKIKRFVSRSLASLRADVKKYKYAGARKNMASLAWADRRVKLLK
jgi:hypothetical protein